MTVGVDLWCAMLQMGEPCSKGCFHLEALIRVNFGSSDSLGNPCVLSPPSRSPFAPPDPPFYLHNKRKAVGGIDDQSHSKSFLPFPETTCWPELSMSGSVRNTQVRDAGCFSFRWTRVSLLGWHFPGDAEGIINLSPCYFSVQPRGRL